MPRQLLQGARKRMYHAHAQCRCGWGVRGERRGGGGGGTLRKVLTSPSRTCVCTHMCMCAAGSFGASEDVRVLSAPLITRACMLARLDTCAHACRHASARMLAQSERHMLAQTERRMRATRATRRPGG
eukprot:304677-Chlamydomonas_euryale.AAC.1